MTVDPRFELFCSQRGLDVFHPVTHQHQIWHPDPYDVETIHGKARDTYERLSNRVGRDVSSDSGRILLLLGESGAGKTHLMRVFRNQTHAQNKGFFSYMQMTSAATNYAQYVLRNTIDSFDKPYYQPLGATTGLLKLSNALAEDSQVIGPNELNLLRTEELNREELVDLIYPTADRAISLDRFRGVDLDLVRALLYLQAGQPAINAKVFKLLRCESLTPFDSKMLGDMGSKDQEDDPIRMLQSIARLIQTVTDGAFVICVDQLEDINETQDAGQSFRRAMQTIVTLAEIPNVIAIVSCLNDFYVPIRTHLPTPQTDRLESDPNPVELAAVRTPDEIRAVITRRLQNLYDSADISVDTFDSLYPFPEETTEYLSGLTTRGVLDWCRAQRDNSIATKQPPNTEEGVHVNGSSKKSLELNKTWNDYLTGTFPPPDDEQSLLRLLSSGIEACAKELGNGYGLTTRVEKGYLITDVISDQQVLGESLLLGLCQKSPSGGGLLRQVDALAKAAQNRIPVLLRTTDFPSNPNAGYAQRIGEILVNGGRRAVIADSDWRTMLAIQSFQQQYGNHPEYQQWLQTEKPLSQLPSLQSILNLNHLYSVGSDSVQLTIPSDENTQSGSSADSKKDIETSVKDEGASIPLPFTITTTLPEPNAPIPLGVTRSAMPEPVKLAPDRLVRHGAFLGGSGSGKTTLALNLIEQLLLRGIPAILLDRKGDLCSYANPDAWEKPLDNPEAIASRQLLRDSIDVAVYTPGTIGAQGRPLSIAITPPGLGELPSGERQQLANYCAMALGGVLNYKQSGQDKTRTAVLGRAIAVLSELQTDNPLSIDRLIDFIAEVDPLLVNAIGVLDPKHCKKLAEDLQTLSILAGHLFKTDYEQLSVEQLLSSNQSNRTPLSVINLSSLGDNANILFWVSQFLLDLNRYAQKHPSGELQAVVLFDEADLYLPAQGKPSTKEPMENLLKRARSAGLGILLATQSPGDLDYKCRDQISSWFVGKVKENTAINKLKPMLSEAKTDVSAKLANQQVGQFFCIQAGDVTSLQANVSLIRAEQVPIEEILSLAANSRR